MKRAFLLFVIVSAISFSCSDKAEKEAKTAEKYEETKLSLEEIEKQSPEKFISVKGTDKKNLIGQRVIKGKITNNAKMATFKDVDVKLSLYSKTGVLLEEDREVIYETLAPGESKTFKTKLYASKGTDSVAMTVMSAKY